MSENLSPSSPQVPHASKPRLFEEVRRLNVPLVDAQDHEHPIAALRCTMEDEHPSILRWGSDAGSNLNRGFGGDDAHPTLEKRTFDNSFIAAYGLIRVGYEETGTAVPGAHQPPEWYMWIRDEAEQTIGDMFSAFNERQRVLASEYPDLLEATQTWAADRIPYHGTGYTIGAVATAAAEMYHAFRKIEETISLERLLEQ